MHRRLVPTSGDHITRKRLHLFHASGRIHYVKLVHLYHLKMCTLQDGHRQGWIPFLYRGRLFYHPMQQQVLGWRLVWYDPRTGIDMHKNGFWWAHMKLLNYREHSGKGCVCQFIYHLVTQLMSPMTARLSLLSSIVGHVTTKAWDQPSKQIWGSSCRALKLIYCFMGIIMAISFHCLLVFLVIPHWIVTMQRGVGQQLQQQVVGKGFAASKTEVEG